MTTLAALVLADTQPTGQTDFDAWKSNVSQAIHNLRDGITDSRHASIAS